MHRQSLRSAGTPLRSVYLEPQKGRVKASARRCMCVCVCSVCVQCVFSVCSVCVRDLSLLDTVEMLFC